MEECENGKERWRRRRRRWKTRNWVRMGGIKAGVMMGGLGIK